MASRQNTANMNRAVPYLNPRASRHSHLQQMQSRSERFQMMYMHAQLNQGPSAQMQAQPQPPAQVRQPNGPPQNQQMLVPMYPVSGSNAAIAQPPPGMLNGSSAFQDFIMGAGNQRPGPSSNLFPPQSYRSSSMAMQNMIYGPLKPTDPPNDVIVLDDDADDDTCAVPNSVISIDVAQVIESGCLSQSTYDGRRSEYKFITKLQQSFCLGVRNCNDHFAVSVLTDVPVIAEQSKLQIRVWAVNGKGEEQFRIVSLRDINDLLYVYLGTMDSCLGLKTIYCQIEISYTPSEICLSNRLNRDHILDEQANAFNKEELSDFKIRVGDETFHVAKAFLSVHSEVFRAMLDHDTAESISGVLTIDDLDAEIVEVMLRYLYTGQVKNLRTHCLELFCVADRYALSDLQDICLNAIYENLDVNLIMHCLELAFAYDRLDTFRDRVIGFAVMHIQQIKRLDGWKDFSLSHPNIIHELLERLA
ncbi:Protein roadkill-like protein [Aphelenchoides besseyi]|nr:Protein roadkill-like protein [Aphelenchoides besseyi]KAI6208765.1 Protein roadkill-like protein [Aphelenchoides besseyi]